MAEWKVTETGKSATCIVDESWEFGLHVVSAYKTGKVFLEYSGADVPDVPLDIVAQLLARDPAGRDAMASAIRAQGWTCCEPGTQAVTVYEGPDGSPRGVTAVTDPAEIGHLPGALRAVPYVRCEAPGTAKPSATGQGGKG